MNFPRVWPLGQYNAHVGFDKLYVVGWPISPILAEGVYADKVRRASRRSGIERRARSFGDVNYGMHFETSHATVQGLKILRSPHLERPPEKGAQLVLGSYATGAWLCATADDFDHRHHVVPEAVGGAFQGAVRKYQIPRP